MGHIPACARRQLCLGGTTDQLVEAIMRQPEDAEVGYFLECDFAVPTEVHDTLNEYLPAPERLCVEQRMVSTYQQQLAENSRLALHCARVCF